MIRALPLLCLLAASCAPVAEGPLIPAPAGSAQISSENTAGLAGTAYRDNILMRFEDAENRYRESVLRSGAGEETSDVLLAENELYLALNKSNVGERELAEALFGPPRAVIEARGTVVAKVKADVLYAQHRLNGGDAAGAANAADLAIERGEAALAAAPDSDDAAVATASAARGRITPEVSALLNDAGDGDADELAIGRLSTRQRLQVLVAQSHYAKAAAIQAGVSGDAQTELAAAEELLDETPSTTALWLRAEVARLSAVERERAEGVSAADAEVAKVVDLTRRYAANERPEALAQLERGRVFVEQGRTSEAIAAYNRALDILARGGRGVGFDELAPYLNLLAEEPSSDERDSAVFLAMQQLRSPVTSDTLARLAARLAAGDGETGQAIRALQDSERETNQLEAQLDLLTTAQVRDVHAIDIARSKLIAARESVAAAEVAVAANAPNYEQIQDRSLGLDQFREVLRPGEVFLQVRIGRTGGVVMAITRDSFALKPVDANLAQTEATVQKVRSSIYRRTFNVPAVRQLYVDFFEPVAAQIAASDTIIYVPDGPLLSLPAGILVAKDPTAWAPGSLDYTSVPWLALEKAVSVTLSASSFYQLRNAPASAATEVFRGFGDSIPTGAAAAPEIARNRSAPDGCVGLFSAIGQLARLEGTAEEVRRLARITNAGADSVVIGRAFTDVAVKADDLSDARILHFATHGLLPVSSECLPEPSLVTSFGGEGSDGLLEAGEIVELKLDADLVVLSACETGGRGATSSVGTGLSVAGGEALSGLVRSFFYAGARNVVASHWEVPDAETVALMESLYGEVAKGKTPNEAMRTARARLAANPSSSHPFFWAAFSIIGDGGRGSDAGPASSASTAQPASNAG